MLAMDMFDVRRVSVLHLEVPFLKLLEQQHGSSRAKRSLKTVGSLFFRFPLTSKVDVDPALESVHGLLAENSHQREESAQDDQPMPYAKPI